VNGAVAHLWNFGTGETFATLDLGQARNFLAWGSVTFADSLSVYDRDNGVAVEVWSVDGNVQWHAGTGGDHLGPDGASTNLRPGGVRAFGRFVTFRLRTFHVSDLEHYGVGCVLTLD
jgi:hypothetical protein